MRIFIAVAATAAMMAACSPDSDKTNPAIATDEAVSDRSMSAPAVGASSFTEGQARDRIIAAGYTDVTALMMADSGAWRGTAMRNGQSTSVTVDYQGNVTAGSSSDSTMPATSPTPSPTTPN